MLNRLTLYLLRSGFITRYTYFILFSIFIYIVATNVKIEEYKVKESYKTNTADIVREIATLFEKYNIINKCKKIICRSNEIRDYKITSYEIDSKNTKNYLLNIRCNAISCYEFIRELENINFVFILQAKSTNIEILESQTLDFKSDMLISFEIDSL